MSTPSLPPEVLHDILKCLPPSKNHEFPFNLLSASLTCPAWRAAALPHFDFHHIRHLFEQHGQTLSDIARVCALLVESRRLGANDGDHIEEITIRMSRALFDGGRFGDEAARCVGSIFRQARNLTGLRLRFKRSDCSEGGMARLCQCIEPSCDKIQRLSLIGHSLLELSGWQIDLSTTNLVSRMINLKDFELFRVTPIPALATALSGLACIERARFTAFDVADVHRCVTGWPALRNLTIETPRKGSCDALWREIGRSCPRLQELTYIRVPSERGCVTQDRGEIAGVVEQCNELEVLDIGGNEGLDDEFLKRVMRAGRALRQLVLDGCHNILTAPGGEWAAVEKPWPLIESIDISNCGGFTEKFVEKIMRECPTLQAIILPEQLEASGCQTLLKTYGFCKNGAGIWKRC